MDEKREQSSAGFEMRAGFHDAREGPPNSSFLLLSSLGGPVAVVQPGLSSLGSLA